MMSSNKKIFITGSTHGIGKATTELFCKNNWLVYGVSSNMDDTRAKELMLKYPNFIHQTIDITNEENIAKFLQENGPFDVAFNNAGIGIAPQEIEEADILKAQRVIDVNLIGTIICLKHELRNMLKGVIINNSSISALEAKTGADMSYSASKAGILRLTAELASIPKYKNKISFFNLIPGYIKTRMTASDNIPSEKLGIPEDVAQLVYDISTNYYTYDSGQSFNYIKEGF